MYLCISEPLFVEICFKYSKRKVISPYHFKNLIKCYKHLDVHAQSQLNAMISSTIERRWRQASDVMKILT